MSFSHKEAAIVYLMIGDELEIVPIKAFFSCNMHAEAAKYIAQENELLEKEGLYYYYFDNLKWSEESIMDKEYVISLREKYGYDIIEYGGYFYYEIHDITPGKGN